jgi:hypothetical protein
MAIINLQSIADKARYFQDVQEMSAEEAKTEALKQSGFEEEFSTELDAELTKLINQENMTEMSNELGNDREKLINRQSTEPNAEHEINPTPPTDDAGATTPTE